MPAILIRKGPEDHALEERAKGPLLVHDSCTTCSTLCYSTPLCSLVRPLLNPHKPSIEVLSCSGGGLFHQDGLPRFCECNTVLETMCMQGTKYSVCLAASAQSGMIRYITPQQILLIHCTSEASIIVAQLKTAKLWRCQHIGSMTRKASSLMNSPT